MVDKYRKIAFLGCLALFFLPFFTVHAEYDGNPVVLVPGMLASFDKKLMLQDIEDNKWGFIWGSNVYKALIKELENYGYEEGKTLFIAYYDWRKPVDETYKKYLMPKIDEARAKSGKRQVDIVAHSMGGLLARAYIQSNNYQDDVNKIVLMGTPNKGSTEAYVVWEGGIYPNSWNVFYKWGFDVLHWNLKRTRKLPNIQPPLSFREFVPSLRDVLPTTNFVKRDGTLLSLSEMAEKNNFLIDLNSSAHLIKSRVKEARIYAGLSGKTMDEIIIGGTCTVEDNVYNRWRDGHPDPDPPTADSDEGDETVLLTSAKLLDIENYTYDGTSHIKIPDDARASVPDFFNPPVLSYLPQPFRRFMQNFVAVPTVRADESDLYVAPDSMLSFTVSPNVNFEVTDPDGKILSLTENQLGEDNANFDDDPADSEDVILVTIRNPKVGKYTLKTTGNTAGDYYIDSTYVNNNGVFNESKEGVIGVNEVKTVDETVSEVDGFKMGEKIGDAVVAIQKTLTTLLDKNKINDPSLIKGDYEKLNKPLSDLQKFLSDFSAGLLKEKKNKPIDLVDKVDDLRSKFADEVDKIIAKGKISPLTQSILLEMKARLLGATLQ